MKSNLWEVLILVTLFQAIIAWLHQDWQDNYEIMKSANWPQTRLKDCECERCNFELYHTSLADHVV